jgi:hypothetical protein
MNESAEIEVYEPPAPPAVLFRSDDPTEIVAQATEIATVLAAVIDAQDLAIKIGGNPRPFVRVEGWTMLGTMLGVFPHLAWSRRIDDNGWEARVEARTLAGQVVGGAESQCTRVERQWKSRDDYALRSMAQTRATSKALRVPLGFVMTLAGYSATPAEEMPVEAPAEAQSDDEFDRLNGQAVMLATKLDREGVSAPPESAESWQEWLYAYLDKRELTIKQWENLVARLDAAQSEFKAPEGALDV